MLPDRPDYPSLFGDFRWPVPDRFNIGVAVADTWAAREPGRVALYDFTEEKPRSLTFAALSQQSNRLAHVLVAAGVSPGDRVAILLPQSFETAIAHAAIYKAGAIAVPLAVLFGVEALSFRLGHCGARAVITDAGGAARIAALRQSLPELQAVFVTGNDIPAGATGFEAAMAGKPSGFDAIDTGPDDPAMMIYTSGTTGPPKGALHGHRVLLGHLPGVQMHHEFLPQEGDRLWTPADWAWAGGLLNVLLPGLYFGVPVVAARTTKFTPQWALDVMERAGVANAFLPPTALKMLKTVPDPRARRALALRTIGSGGESLGRETFVWAREQLGVTINEFYGQTECNLVLGSCATLGVTRPGAIGLPTPGHVVDVIDADGNPAPDGVPGQIAVRRPDPVMFLGYWKNEAATAAKFIGDWMTTGDQGVRDPDGYVHFFGRDDDVITSSGYRIGPGEVEDCLIGHPAIALAAAVGKPDPVRTEIVKAYVVLKPGHSPGKALEDEIRLWVRERLSAHEYPREIAFVDDMPLTTTGKVIRRVFRDRAIAEAREAAGTG